MFSLARILAPPEHAVHSLAVQAQMVQTVKEQSRFERLVRHFLNSFLNNEMVSSDGEAKAHLLQIGYAIALPQLIVALFLFAPYHQPHPRPFWSQVSDHYFYVTYSMVVVGAVTIFEWDLFFPNVVDVFVLSSLPISERELFRARIAAIAIFLLALIVGLNLLGIIFLPAASDLPSLVRHVVAHFLAITGGGVFAAGLVLAIQEIFLAALGQHLFQKISPVLQGLFITVLLIVLFLFPVISHFLHALLESHNLAARYFPPFWFLGVYEGILRGTTAAPVFAGPAQTGVLATLGVVALAALFYPVAYWRRMKMLLEGRPARDTRSWLERPVNFILHTLLVRIPVRRAIYHFISLTLTRTHRQRVYLAMYGGAGLALAIASALWLKITAAGRIGIIFSADGLRATIPIVAFWTIAGLRNAFVSPVDQRGSWIFKAIQGRPGLDQLMPARNWVLLWSLVVTLGTVAVVYAIALPALRGWSSMSAQVIVAAALCLLLRDIFLLRMKTIPFTGARATWGPNRAFILIQYFGLFPPLVLLTLEVEAWMQASFVHTATAVLAVLALHLWLLAMHKKTATEHADLLDVDEEEEEFPQRLGLRY